MRECCGFFLSELRQVSEWDRIQGGNVDIEEVAPMGTFPNEDMSEMTLRLAHEIRNPLATIKSASQLVRRLRMSPDDALPYLDGVIKGVARIDETIRDMEEFVSLAAGTPQPVQVEKAVSQVLASFKNMANRDRRQSGERGWTTSRHHD